MTEMIPLAKIRPAGDNLRRNLGDVAGLAASIEAVGLQEPLIVGAAGDGTHAIIAGHRRYAALQLLGRADAECIVRDLDDATRLEVMLIENLQREDLGPLEEAEGYRRLGELGISQREIARRCGVGQANVSKKLSLLTLPDDVRADLDSSRISVDTALRILALSRRPVPDVVDPPPPPDPLPDPEPPAPEPPPRRPPSGRSVLFAGKLRTPEGIDARRRRHAARSAAQLELVRSHRGEYEALLADELWKREGS
jgi:ParB/RepB/Spo0J family partition protein